MALRNTSKSVLKLVRSLLEKMFFYEVAIIRDLLTNRTCDTSRYKSVMQVEIPLRIELAPQSSSNEHDGVGSSQPSPLPPLVSHYIIARDKERRQFVHFKRFVKTDIVFYALSVIEGLIVVKDPLFVNTLLLVVTLTTLMIIYII